MKSFEGDLNIFTNLDNLMNMTIEQIRLASEPIFRSCAYLERSGAYYHCSASKTLRSRSGQTFRVYFYDLTNSPGC